MRAAWYERHGAARDVLQLGELPTPEPQAGEVRVRVHVSGVNPTDCKARSGAWPLEWPRKVPHQDGSGLVDAVGSGVDPARVGERVWLYHAAWQRPLGSAAEYVCVPAQQAVPLPDGVGFHHGAGVGVPYMTAYRCLFADGGLDGRTVLVTGGAGAVGHASVQLAVRAGAQVIATVSTDEKAAVAVEAGARHVVNYREEDVAARLAALAPDGVDRVVDVDFAANLPQYAERLAPHAAIASYASPPEIRVDLPWRDLRERNVTIRGVLIYRLTDAMFAEVVSGVNAALASGILRPLPEHRLGLDDIVAVHELVERGVLGKVLLEVP